MKIMAILNVTPDSFSDGGKYKGIDDILFNAERLINEGADIIDIGGESTRPGALKVSAEEETERIAPVIKVIKSRFDVPISVDTYKAKVAAEAIREGALIINDISGGKLDPMMYKTVASYGINKDIKYVLTHNVIGESGALSGNVSESDIGLHKAYYVNLLKNELLQLTKEALSEGIKKENIILDPGLGFNKTYEQNLWIMDSLSELCKLNGKSDGEINDDNGYIYPLLVGASRKSFIGKALDREVNERLSGTLATSVIAYLKGASYIRVHDVKENADAVKMAEAIINS